MDNGVDGHQCQNVTRRVVMDTNIVTENVIAQLQPTEEKIVMVHL